MSNIITSHRRPDITFYKNGRIIISSRVARKLNMAPGSAINILEDDGEYLLFALDKPMSNSRLAAQCMPVKKGGKTLYAHSVDLARNILNAARVSSPKASFMTGQLINIAGAPHIYIITSHPL